MKHPCAVAVLSLWLVISVSALPRPKDEPSPTSTTETPTTMSPDATAPSEDEQQVDTSGMLADSMMSLSLKLGLCPPATNSCEVDKNTVLSPLSIASILTILMAGSEGATYDQLRQALNYPSHVDDNGVDRAYRSVLDQLKAMGGGDAARVQLDVANAIFSESDLFLDYSVKMRDSYDADLLKLNMSADPKGSAAYINDWVSRRTRGKIANIMADSLPPDTHLVAANAVYLKAAWAKPFDPKSTDDEDFYVSAERVERVPTMFSSFQVEHITDSDVGIKMIALPYKDDRLAMYLAVPTKRFALRELEEKLADAALLPRLMTSMARGDVNIQLPRFRIEQRHDLKNSLKELGVLDIFKKGAGNVSRITEVPGGAVDDMVHQAVIEVTESGTEGAGATLVLLTRDGTALEFSADQPFLYWVRDKSTGSIIFSGRVVNPKV